MNRFLLALLGFVLAVGSAPAHPLPNLRYDRTIHVRVSPTGVVVKFTLELNDWTMVLDGKNLFQPAELKDLTGQFAYARKYAEKKAPLLADNLRATLDGAEVRFQIDKPPSPEPERDHVRLVFQFRGDWKPDPAKRHTFHFEDQNFEDRSGSVTLTLDQSGTGLDLIEVEEPIDLRGKSPLELKPGDELRLRRASCVFELEKKDAPTAPNSTPTPQTPSAEPVEPPSPPPPEPSVVESLRDRGLHALFDTNLGLGLMLLLSGLFGAAHAFTPGHGKTMVAAYLVGERGTIKHATVLGLVATLTHTGSVILLAVVMYIYYGDTPPESAQGWLTLLGGLLIAGVGLWLFLQRVRGRADHVHLFSGHDHHHHHGHDHTHSDDPHHDHHHHHHGPPVESAKSNFGWMRVILLGLGGGIIPCWDAVLLFLVALTRGKVGLAIPLLFSFSTGLAAVLIGLGVAVVLANRAGGRRFGEHRWFKLLPVVSAVVLLGLGVWFARDGFQMLVAAEKARTAVRS